MYDWEVKPQLQEKIEKLSKRDKLTYERVMKKIEEIVNNPNPDHYKNLTHELKDRKRVHIGHFVLVFKFADQKIEFLDFEHHDKIYRV